MEYHFENHQDYLAFRDFFAEKERAIEYADFYVTRNLRLKRFRYEERKEDPYYRAYDTGHDLTQWVRIKPIGEKGE